MVNAQKNIVWYLARPRKVNAKDRSEFRYQKVMLPSRSTDGLVWGWMVKYKNEDVMSFYTKKEAVAFITEKLNT